MEDKKKIIKIGILALSTLIALYWGVNYLSGNNLFSHEQEFYAIYNKVDGLTPSSIVSINGLKVGQVKDIYFKEDGSNKLMVIFSVGKQYKIAQNSIAYIYSADIMGTKAIKLELKKDSVFHVSGDTLNSGIEGDLKDQVSMQMLPLKYKIEDLLGSTDSVLAVVQNIFNKQTRENLSKSFASVKNTIKNLESTTSTLDTLMTNQKTKMGEIIGNTASVTANLKNNNEKITKTLSNLLAFTDSLSQSNIKQTIQKTNTSVSKLNEILEKMNSGEGTISQLLNNDTLYNYVVNVTVNLNKLLRDLRKNPKRYVHFSAVDMGRTVYKVEREEKGKKANKKK